MDSLGAPGAGLTNAVDTVFPFVPSEIILPVAGFTAGQGRMSPVAVIFWTTVGSIVGSLVVYFVGAALGRDRTRRIAAKVPFVKAHEIDKVEAWFARHGTKTVFFARMVPVFRSLISIPAGVERMPLATFIGYTAAGSLIWNTVFVMAGFWLGDNWRLVEEYGGIVSKGVAGVAVLLIGYFFISRIPRPRGRHRS